MPLDGEIVKNQLRLRRKANKASVNISAEQQLLITIPLLKQRPDLLCCKKMHFYYSQSSGFIKAKPG